jgi:hypothetical protein
MQSLRANSSVRLGEIYFVLDVDLWTVTDLLPVNPEYDWVAMWRSILSLSAFVVSKIDVIEDSTKINELISQVNSFTQLLPSPNLQWSLRGQLEVPGNQ